MTRPYNQIPLKKDLDEIIKVAYKMMFQTGAIEFTGKTPLRKGQSFSVKLIILPTRIPITKPKLVRTRKKK